MPVFPDIPGQILQPGESPEERHKLIHTAAWTIFACLHKAPRWILKTKINLTSTNCGYSHHLSKRGLDRNPERRRFPTPRAAECWPRKVKSGLPRRSQGPNLQFHEKKSVWFCTRFSVHWFFKKIWNIECNQLHGSAGSSAFLKNQSENPMSPKNKV